MIATIFEIMFAALLLFGVWHKEKLIDFEDRMEDRIAWLVAMAIRKVRGR